MENCNAGHILVLLPNVVMEVMTAAKPVVATDVGGNSG